MVPVEFVRLPLLMTSPVTPVLSRMTRPVPVCEIVPRFVTVALLPVIVTATVLPATVKVPVASTLPVSPAASVRAVVDGAEMVNDVADTPRTLSATDVMKTMMNAEVRDRRVSMRNIAQQYPHKCEAPAVKA